MGVKRICLLYRFQFFYVRVNAYWFATPTVARAENVMGIDVLMDKLSFKGKIYGFHDVIHSCRYFCLRECKEYFANVLISPFVNDMDISSINRADYYSDK